MLLQLFTFGRFGGCLNVTLLGKCLKRSYLLVEVRNILLDNIGELLRHSLDVQCL